MTLYILTVVIDFVSGALDPFIALLRWVAIIGQFERVRFASLLIEVGVYPYVVDFFTELVALIVPFLIVATVGTLGRNRYGECPIDVFGFAVTSTPGVGTVYKGFRRMGDVMLDEGGGNVRDSKLVRCFEEDVYVSGFVTSESREPIETSTGHDDMVSMFLPVAPNPVTGGLLTYVPESDVYDIDMTVEEGSGASAPAASPRGVVSRTRHSSRWTTASASPTSTGADRSGPTRSDRSVTKISISPTRQPKSR